MGSNSASVAAPISDLTPSAQFSRPTYLMCSPQWYDVDYVINPWMAGNVHRPSRDVAFNQWKALYQHLQAIADVRLLHPRQGSPDMVFVGHAALVNHGVAAISSFAHAQRQTEEMHLRRWLQEHGFLLWETPRETAFEGEGDALFDADGQRLWAAHGVRTCRYSHQHVADAWHTRVTSLHLIDPRFYHLDTCFAPLAGGYLLYYPEAFDAASLELIESAYPAETRIAVSEAEATQFACNVINIGRKILMNPAGEPLRCLLTGHGFEVIETPLGEFLKSGASAKSLALRLSDVSVTHGVGVV
ncbi:N-Dimethylarginine dimethylaminohydrolase [Granulicella rosea]|uniref:N-Dimethylarginine dimethylaminohydrolase n=1 Tax=Granulicella rosea TaxID=474952 RepID=A0A239J9G4_9BACT|nr:arginine deiminase-related protein [Granulicella rosea]SNT02656.1 N-Dimethylarginine dimethylaminohydrolase [Granulicella rosea]